MKVRSLCIFLAVALLIPLGFWLYTRSHYIFTEEELLSLAAELFETGEDKVSFAGKTTDTVKDGLSFADFWYIDRSDPMEAQYLRITCEERPNGRYWYAGKESTFSAPHEDILTDLTGSALVVLVNNPACASVRFSENGKTEDVEVSRIPFLYAAEDASSCIFLDAEGQPLEYSETDSAETGNP